LFLHLILYYFHFHLFPFQKLFTINHKRHRLDIKKKIIIIVLKVERAKQKTNQQSIVNSQQSTPDDKNMK